VSYCAIVTFRDGKPAEYEEFRNSWGGAAYVWDALFNRYLRESEYDSWMSRTQQLWDLSNSAEVPRERRAVLLSTFDYALVMRADFAQFASDLRAFRRDFGIVRPNKGIGGWKSYEVVCHLDGWAAFVESLDAEAVGFYGTSVGENLWYSYDEETEESVPYDMATGTKHWSVYEALGMQKVGAP
jgi:hypothetical protein